MPVDTVCTNRRHKEQLGSFLSHRRLLFLHDAQLWPATSAGIVASRSMVSVANVGAGAAIEGDRDKGAGWSGTVEIKPPWKEVISQ
jgi:hypothetical protein